MTQMFNLPLFELRLEIVEEGQRYTRSTLSCFRNCQIRAYQWRSLDICIQIFLCKGNFVL